MQQLVTVGFVAPNFQQGPADFNAYYLPYSVGVLWTYASQFEEISSEFKLGPIIWRRDDVPTVVDQLKDSAIIGFSTYVWNKNSHGSPIYSPIVHSKAPYRFLRMLLKTLFSNFSDIRACRPRFHQGRPGELLVASELPRWHWCSLQWVGAASLYGRDPPRTQRGVPCPWWVGWIYLVSLGAKLWSLVSWLSMF